MQANGENTKNCHKKIESLKNQLTFCNVLCIIHKKIHYALTGFRTGKRQLRKEILVCKEKNLRPGWDLS